MKKIMLLFAATLLSVSCLFASVPTPAPTGDNIKVEVISESEGEEFKECKIRIKGTYDGKEIDVTVTVEADNCAVAAGELLKAFAQ